MARMNKPQSMPPGFQPTDLSDAWTVVWQTSEAREYDEELGREVTKGHILHGLEVQAVAIRRHGKEVIYWVVEKQSWAVVHLTWSEERDLRWPTADLLREWPDVMVELADRGRP
jgi:hypothetical protein